MRRPEVHYSLSSRCVSSSPSSPVCFIFARCGSFWTFCLLWENNVSYGFHFFKKKKMLARPPEFDKDHFSKGLWDFVFCFVLGSYPMASKNTDALSLLALPGVQTNLTDSSLIAQSLSRGDAGGLAASSLSEAGISQAVVRGRKVK